MRSLEVITPILTRKKAEQIENEHLFLDLSENQHTEQTTGSITEETRRYIERIIT